MEWLHFSDFHFGHITGAQNEAMSCLLNYIQAEFARNPGRIDAIFLVGDISYAGKACEYNSFEKDFLRPLLAIPSLQQAKVFSVPGNHDVDCDAGLPISWEKMTRYHPIFFTEHINGQKARATRATVFRNYQDFVQRNNVISPDPFQMVSLLTQAESFPFDILTLNTAFFADKDEKSDAPITPCPMSSLHDRVKLGRTRPLLILGHHPPDCFRKDQQKPFKTFLLDNKAVYLFGHKHEAAVIPNVDGTIQGIGFGAVYMAPLGQTTHAPYRNTFTRCRIDGQLFLKAYSWDSEVGRWDDTTKTSFSECITPHTFSDGSVILNVPLLSKTSPAPTVVSSLQTIPRRTPQPTAVVPLSLTGGKIWKRLLILSDNINTYYRNEGVPPSNPPH